MPVRVGFTEYRKRMLEQELARIEDLLPNLGLKKVVLTGAMAAGDYAPDSHIELIIVQETDRPFGRRADFFSWHLNSFVGVDTLVYTPEEFEACRETLPALKQACETGRLLFDDDTQV